MVLVKVLKRKDASSVLVAVALALLLTNFLSTVSFDLASRLTEFVSGKESEYLNSQTSIGWDQIYLLPTFTLLVQVVILELVVRLVISLKSFWKSAK